jgi:diadenosine tetraphosphatase ApaH/serine/threonine PP2A family protein phosphatase
MRHALISDIHGNLEAFEAVCAAISREKVDRYIFIGDIVGYGADPARCIELLRAISPAVLIAGNHEWGVCGLLGLDYFNDYAAAAVVWTKGVLKEEEVSFLRSFGLVHEDGVMTLVHGTVDSPEKFYYVLDAGDAARSMRFMKTRVCFVGHSHSPGIYSSDDASASRVTGDEAKLETAKRYVINIGSVGQPRDGDPRASYAVFDDTAGTVAIRRVRYDIGKAQEKILAAALPPALAYRLGIGR